LEVWWIAGFPNETCAASVRRNHERISGFAGLRFPIGDLAKRETVGANVIKNDEAMIDRRSFRAGNERWLIRRCALRVGVSS